ncbi:MAG: hypothetical protein EOP84_17865, partial [Verrucomicrobiaceae bacterium]
MVISGVTAALILIGADVRAAEPSGAAAASDVAGDPLDGTGPVEPVPMEDEGYYPTIEETMLLGGDYHRMGNRRNNSPDYQNQFAQGITPYPNPGESYRAPWENTFSPLNPFLGFFAPNQALVSEDERLWPRGMSFELDSSFPLLIRDFNPERAMVKAGPTYLDLMFIGMTVLHSDYQGDQAFDDDSEDGWLIGIEFGLRGMVQFTDQFYLSLAATLVYLPLENEIGFRLGSGGVPTIAATLDYRIEARDWDLRFYDTFYGGLGSDLFAGLDEEGFQQAGRYSFGFREVERTSEMYNGDNSFFTNALGFDSTTPVGQDWRFWFSAKHADTWRTLDFEDHLAHNSLFARIGYNGEQVGFSPALEYYLDHYDYPNGGDSTISNRVYLTIKGRITENLRMEARAGYLWLNGSDTYEDGYLYSVDLNHELSRYTTHSLSAGRDYFSYDLTGDSVVSDYIRYGIRHAFTKEFSGAAWVQYSEDEGRLFEGERTNVTALLRYTLFNGNASAIQLRGAYEHRNGSNGQRGDRWLGRLSYTQNLFSRTYGEIFYQYEE